MDARLLRLLACPACRTGLAFDGDVRDCRVLDGTLTCAQCGRRFAVRDEVAVLVLEGTSLDGLSGVQPDEEYLARADYYLQRYADASRGGDSLYAPPYVREHVEALLRCQGLIIDIAIGPGGSYCFRTLRRAPDDIFYVANDLSEPLLRAQHESFRTLGLDRKASFVVFDARRMPFLDGAASAFSSVLGFANVRRDHVEAYREAWRVLEEDGLLVDWYGSVFEEGSKSAAVTRERRGYEATLPGVSSMLSSIGFRIEKVLTVTTDRGKRCPGDGLPIDNEVRSSIALHARKCASATGTGGELWQTR